MAVHDIQKWQSDINILRNYRTNLADKLSIYNSELFLVENNHQRYFFDPLSISPHPEALAQHIEKLIIQTARPFFEKLKEAPIYEEVTQFRKEVKILRHSISNILEALTESYKARYHTLFKTANELYHHVEELKKQLKAPELATRPKQQIEYTERTELSSIKPFLPKRVLIKEVLNAAKEALRLAHLKGELTPRTKLEKTAKEASRIAFWSVPFFAAMLIDIPKKLFYDPITQDMKGEEQRGSPIKWVLRKYLDEMKEAQHSVAFQAYLNQLMNQSIITDEAADGFCELAPHALVLDLERALLASGNVMELEPYIKPRALHLKEFLEKAQVWFENKKYSSICLKDVKHYYKWNNRSFIVDEDSLLNVEISPIRVPHAVKPHISPQNLIKMLRAAALSPSCKTLILSKELLSLDLVQEFLARNAYKEQPESNQVRSLYGKVFIR